MKAKTIEMKVLLSALDSRLVTEKAWKRGCLRNSSDWRCADYLVRELTDLKAELKRLGGAA